LEAVELMLRPGGGLDDRGSGCVAGMSTSAVLAGAGVEPAVVIDIIDRDAGAAPVIRGSVIALVS
jgi:hypothetical protein